MGLAVSRLTWFIDAKKEKRGDGGELIVVVLTKVSLLNCIEVVVCEETTDVAVPVSVKLELRLRRGRGARISVLGALSGDSPDDSLLSTIVISSKSHPFV